MRASLITALPILTLVAAACGGGSDQPDTEAQTTTAGTPGGGGTPATTIHLVVGGGPHAGTYDAKSDDLSCTHGVAGPGIWGNQYSVSDKKPNEFSSLQLLVPDTKDAADGTDRFLLTAGFGELMQSGYTEYTINTGVKISGITKPGSKPEGGSGTVMVEDKGNTGKVSFKGKTTDDVTLEGTIDCHQLMRGGG